MKSHEIIFTSLMLLPLITASACSKNVPTLKDKNSTSISETSITKETISTKQKMEELYKDKSGFGINNEECDHIIKEGGAPTYGEILYESVEKIINKVKPTKKDVFVDLGSGIGKVAVQFRLSTNIKEAFGVELSQTRVKHALSVKSELIKQHLVANKKGKKLNFYEQNILNANLKNVTIAFMCATCFSEDLMRKITQKLATECKIGLKLITLKKLPENKWFKFEKEMTLPMTWSSGSSVYFYKLIVK